MLAVLRAVAAGSLPDLTDADLAAVPPLVARAVPGYPAMRWLDLRSSAQEGGGGRLGFGPVPSREVQIKVDGGFRRTP